MVCTDAFCCSDQCHTDLAGLGKGYRTGDFGDCLHRHPDANRYADGYSYLDSKRYTTAHIYANIYPQFYANAISYFHPYSHPNTDVHVYVYAYSYRHLHSNPHSNVYASSYAHAYSHANPPASGLD